MFEKLDITKPAKEIIIDKFNAKSGIHLDYEHVELGVVEALAQPNDKENTSIELVPTLVGSFLNTFHLRYKRMDLSDVFGAPYINIPSDGYVTLYELLMNINLAIGLNLTVDDVEDELVYEDLGDPTAPKTILIKAKDTSVFFIGQATVALDVDLNPITDSYQTNSTIYALREVTGGADYLTAHAFDGYKGNSFQFLRNIDLITVCKIDSIFSLENSTIVLNGTFQFVAPELSFINPADTYKTITINRVGDILSARIAESLLSLVNKRVTKDPVEKFYYVVDTAGTLGINPKNTYRLFENGTVDSTFNHSTLPNGMVAVIPAKQGYFTIHKVALNYYIKRFTLDGTWDTNFTDVGVKTNSGTFIKIFGFTSYNDLDEETLHLCMSSDLNSVSTSPDFTAQTVVTSKSSTVTSFYSPFFTVKDNGDLIEASGELAKYNAKDNIETRYWYPELLKNVSGTSAIYALNSFNVNYHETVTPLIIGQDKEYRPKLVDSYRSERVTNIKKVLQTHSGYETYVAVDLIRKDNNPTNQTSSAILAFSVDHTPSGIIVTNNNSNETIKDLAVLNR